jgi:DNA-binding response OmpR family regulator
VQSNRRIAAGDGARRLPSGPDPQPVLFAVEDDPSTLELLRDVAVHAGWALRGFTQLADFERAVAQRVPDLVILDDDLPDGRGGDRVRELRRDRRLRDVPVLVCTAASARRQAEIGAWAPVVGKPFAIGEIEIVLHDAARRRRLEAPSAGG